MRGEGGRVEGRFRGRRRRERERGRGVGKGGWGCFAVWGGPKEGRRC